MSSAKTRRAELLVEAGCAAVAFGAMAWTWPRQDPFYGTVLVLPWILLGFSWIARRLQVTTPLALRAALALALLGLPLRRRLGWPQADALWAAALLVLLGAFLWHLLPRLRRVLSRSLSGRGAGPGWIFFLVPTLAYLAILPWALEHRQPDGDEPYYLLLSHSLAHDRDARLDNNYAAEDWRRFMEREIEPQPGDPRGPRGEIYSRHNALLPALLTPFYAVGGRWGASLAMVLLSAAVAWLTLRVALRLWPERPSGALCAWAVMILTPPLTVYSHQIWVEVPAALLVIAGLDAVLRLHARHDPDSTIPWTAVVQLGVVLALLPLLKLRFLLVAAPLALLAAWPLRRRKGAALTLAGGLAAALGAMLLFNARRYGNPLKMYGTEEWRSFLSPPADYARGAFGMFYDCAFGLFAVAPVWMLLLPAVALLIARRERFLGTLLGLGGPYLLALAPRLEWYGGWSPPFRYPLALLPLLTLAMVPLLDRRRPGLRLLVAGLGAITAVLSIFWLVVPGWVYHLADGGNDLLHRMGWMLQGDVARLFPSTVRPRPAIWLWILGSLALVPVAFSRRRVPRPVIFGPILVLAVAAIVPWLAHALPTTVIHGEDRWVAKQGGRLEPDRWTPARPSKVGAWLIPGHGELRAGVVPGGERVRIRLVARREKNGPQSVHVFAGDQPLTVLHVSRFHFWESLDTEIVDWPAGEPLVLRCPRDRRKNPDTGVMVDRVELEWQ